MILGALGSVPGRIDLNEPDHLGRLLIYDILVFGEGKGGGMMGGIFTLEES